MLEELATRVMTADYIEGILPHNVQTILDAVDYYRKWKAEKMVKGLSILLENNQGIGHNHILSLYFKKFKFDK